MEEQRSLKDMSLIEKEALCYRLLVARDEINEQLREAQESISEDVKMNKELGDIK